MVSYERFIDDVRMRGGLEDPSEAERVARATVQTLGERLPDVDVRALAEELPGSLASALGTPGGEGELTPDALYDRVHWRLGGELGYAVEQAQVVCQVVGEHVSGEARQRLRRHLPEDVAELFEPRHIGPQAPRPFHPSGSHPTTLADGFAGSAHPLFAAGPFDHAHSGSVVHGPNPKGASKLSSAEGISTVRQGETLAEGQPGSQSPVSETD